MATPSVIDLRSDTVTRPTVAMRQAIAAAEVGDDVFGDDPTVQRLERTLAERLGFEAALFLPTATQANLVAMLSHCRRGDEVLVGHQAHTYRWEGGGGAALAGVQPQAIAHQPDGTLALADIEAAIKIDDVHFAVSRLLALENTLGGKVMPMAWLADATALARRRGLATHLDGARLFNAAAAVAERDGGDAWGRAREIAGMFDTVTVCFSKGLGAPVGAALCGTAELIARARRWRKTTGGGLRQAGLLAAGALHALDHHVERLAEDHANARRLADGLQGLAGVAVEPPQTNIVFVDLPRDRIAAAVQCAREAGVLCDGRDRLRLVTHLDVNADDIARAIGVLRDALA